MCVSSWESVSSQPTISVHDDESLSWKKYESSRWASSSAPEAEWRASDVDKLLLRTAAAVGKHQGVNVRGEERSARCSSRWRAGRRAAGRRAAGRRAAGRRAAGRQWWVSGRWVVGWLIARRQVVLEIPTGQATVGKRAARRRTQRESASRATTATGARTAAFIAAVIAPAATRSIGATTIGQLTRQQALAAAGSAPSDRRASTPWGPTNRGDCAPMRPDSYTMRARSRSRSRHRAADGVLMRARRRQQPPAPLLRYGAGALGGAPSRKNVYRREGVVLLRGRVALNEARSRETRADRLRPCGDPGGPRARRRRARGTATGPTR